MNKTKTFLMMAAMIAASANLSAIDLSVLDNLQYSTSESSAARRLELRAEGTVGHALVIGTEYKGDPNGSSSASWDTTSLSIGWQTLTSGTNTAAVLKLDPNSVAIEGGRLSSSATWTSAKTHVVRNWVVVPDGVTLTISQGTIVKFCESAGIKVLSGGKVQINGAEGADVFFASIGNDTYGGDTNMRTGDFETNSYEVVTLNGGLWSDNGYWVTPDAQLRGYPEVTLHDSLASISDGVVRIPVTVEGTRNAPFSIDWQITGSPFSTTSGTLSWSQSSEGTKYIEIPLKSTYVPSGVETFTVRATLARSVTRANETAQVKVFKGDLELSTLQFSTSAASTERRLELREEGTVGHALVSGTEYKGDPNGSSSASWDTSALANGWQTLTSGTNAAAVLKLDPNSVAIEGGRLPSSTTWTSAKTHVVRNWVVVPDGVTLTISQGTIVKFCESAGIKVLSGGQVQINGAEGADVFFASIGNDTYGGDTNMRTGDFETNSYEIVTLNGGTWSDNGYWVTPDAAVRPYPTVELHDAIAAVEGGVVRVPVTVEGTRNAPFSIDWELTSSTGGTSSSTGGSPVQDLNALAARSTGTLTWSQSSEGTKFIEIPLKANYSPFGTETFALSATRARSVNLSNETARVSVYSGYIAVGDVIENGESGPSAGTEIETRGIGGTMIAKALENITYSPRWSGAASCTVTIDGRDALVASATEEGSTTWTRPSMPGLYTFTHKAGAETLTARFAVLGADVVIHEGTLTISETWGTGKTHLVIGTVTVKSGVTLTIEPGAVVKFMPGAKLIVEAGGTCIAKGVKFTHAYDDAVGGDTLFDGAATLPVMEDYEIKGTVTDDDSTEYRYTAPIVLSGTITANTTWRGWKVYNVTGNLTIKSGVTLTVEPGTVVKFNSGVSLTVSSGATLNAIGTRAQPIVFTSIKDDEFGGDTNGDGEKSYPWAGDWARIYAGGTLNMNYCRIRYCNNNSDQGAIQGSGGTVLFDNGIIEASTYECVRMNSGSFTAHNSVFRDASMGFGYYGGSGVNVYNCVVADCTIACRASNKHFYNTVFYNCYTFLESTSSSCDHCVFYNEPGLGAQSVTQVGSNGNIWGDPKFVDAENGDFRIQKGSPCINAGDAANAPEYDYYGQPRDDGAPDIGIYELAGGMSANDLAAVGGPRSVAAATTIGDTLTISYEVANVGKQAVSGSWRDKVSLVSADGGYSIDLGTVVQTAALAVCATNTFNASFTVPTDAEGTWRVAVNVNAERDIYEGANITNNTAASEGTFTVSMPARAAADGFSGTATKGAPAAAKFALSGTEPMVARINAPAGTVVYLGSGFMPSASSYSARAVVGADGGLIGIPAGVTSAYLLVETTSSKGVAFTMTLESAALAVQSVTPSTLPYTGTTGLVIDGANFAEGCTVIVERAAGASGTGEPPVLLSTVVSPTRMTAQIDCSRLTAGATYSVKVIAADGATATLPNVLTVAKVPAAPKLKATLDAPASVRRGRTLTVYIDYENIGNADMPAPVFELISEGQVFKIDGACYTNSVKVMGLSSEAPVGTLRPGEPQRLGIPVTILAENVTWKLRSYHAAQESAKTTRFSLRELYDEDWVLYHVSDDDATITKLRAVIGSTFADYYTSLGAWLGMVEPRTKDYEVLKSAFGRYQYLKAAGMLESDVATMPSSSQSPGELLASTAVGNATLLAAKSPCSHHLLVGSQWKQSKDGSVWKWCSTCENWALAVTEVENSERLRAIETIDNTPVYIIVHGNANSVDESWIREMGSALANKGTVLAINWGEGATKTLFGVNPGTGIDLPGLRGSAMEIPKVVNEAIDELKILNLQPGNTTIIGHSHGAHVGANIMTYWDGAAGMFMRFVGLDTSTTDNGVHDQNTMRPVIWMRDIRDVCSQVEFYKTSFDDSLEEAKELYGHCNFMVVRTNDFYEYVSGFLPESFNLLRTPRHQYACEWFTESIKQKWSNIGFDFKKGDSNSWKTLMKNKGNSHDIANPGPAERNKESRLAGVIRGNFVELVTKLRNDSNSDNWDYAGTVLSDQGWGTTKSAVRLANNVSRTVDYRFSSQDLPSCVAPGDKVEIKVQNAADNLSVPYKALSGMERVGSPWPWDAGIGYGAWLIDCQTMTNRDASAKVLVETILANGGTITSAQLTSLLTATYGGKGYDCIRFIGGKQYGKPSVRGGDVAAFVCPESSTNVIIQISNFDNNLFGSDRPLQEYDEEGRPLPPRKLLLLVGAAVDLSNGITDSTLPNPYRWDIYADDNFVLREVTSGEKGCCAVISTAASSRNSVSTKSARLLSSVQTHQLSANALKPGEVVQVKADKDGNWSIDLDASESYTTDDEDEITVNRFELIDTSGKKGTAAMRKTDFGSGTDYQSIDFPWVTVHGQLPMTTDADGNPVCEGERYTVQLTVASTGEEDDVTTCILDVRSATDEDDGEDEDEDGSNEPKSCDPNAMEGDEGVGEKRLVKPGDTLTYTVYFENKSDADAAAACVEVVNPLNEWLDWSSLTMIDVGFNNHVDSGLYGKHEGESEKALDGTNTTVRTEFKVAYYDEEGNVVEGDDGDGGRGATALPDGVAYAQAEWYLRIIDPNGDSEGWPLDMTGGFLPPNDDTHCGEGYIRYKVKVRDDAPGNVVITNSATIIFDHWDEDALETDPAWWNTVGSLGVQFTASEAVADEGGSAEIRVSGGNADLASSVKVYLTYNTAAAADVDLKNGTVDSSTGSLPVQEGNAQAARSTNLKFPLTLNWAKGEIGEKVITIPVKTDKTVEDDEFLTFQLADAQGLDLGEDRVCTVTIHDHGYDDLASKIKAGTATKAEQTAWEKLQKAKAPYVRGLADPANAGKVTGSGLCAAGKKVTLKATANKGFVFMGWVDSPLAINGERQQSTAINYIAKTPSLVIDRSAKPAKDSATSTTIANVAEDVTYYADFITSEEDRAAVTLAVNGADIGNGDGAAATQGTLETNIICGVAVKWPVVSSGLSATTVKVSGLPAGLKFTDKPLTSKVGKGKTAVVVTNVPANTIYGAPTAASKVDAKKGVVPSEVKVTVTTAGKTTATFILMVTVNPLPDWAAGTFTGFVQGTEDGNLGSATMTVAANGKVSGKIALDGTNWTFKADSFSRVEHVERVDESPMPGDGSPGSVGTNFVAVAAATAGKATKAMTIIVGDGGSGATAPSGLTNGKAEGETEDGGWSLALWRGIWKDKATAAAAKSEIAKWEGVYTLSLAPGDGYGSGYLSLTVGKDGNVKATGKLADGTSVSATSPLMYDPDAGCFAYFYVAPSAYKGGCFALAVRFNDEGRGEGVATCLEPVDSMGNAQWTSWNSEATGEYGAGFSREVAFTGAYYDKLATLRQYYEALRVSLEGGVPSLAYTYKETRVGNGGKKATASSVKTAEAVDTSSQSGMTVSVDEKGALVVTKATKPAQDRVSKEWSYIGDNDGALTLSFTQATGIFKGSYTFWYDYMSAYDATKAKDQETWTHTSKKVNFEGIAVQGADVMRGFYLWDASSSYTDPKTKKEKTYKYKESYTVVMP